MMPLIEQKRIYTHGRSISGKNINIRKKTISSFGNTINNEQIIKSSISLGESNILNHLKERDKNLTSLIKHNMILSKVKLGSLLNKSRDLYAKKLNNSMNCKGIISVIKRRYCEKHLNNGNKKLSRNIIQNSINKLSMKNKSDFSIDAFQSSSIISNRHLLKPRKLKGICSNTETPMNKYTNKINVKFIKKCSKLIQETKTNSKKLGSPESLHKNFHINNSEKIALFPKLFIANESILKQRLEYSPIMLICDMAPDLEFIN